MTHLWAPVAVMAVAAVVAGGCGDEPDRVSSAPQLDGLTYVAGESIGSVQGHVLVPGTQVTISFRDGSLSAHAGCNQLGGTYAIDGSVLRVEGLFSTEMACDEELMDQDAWLSGLLSSSPSLTQDGDQLTITGETSSLTLVDREIADPDRSLTDTTWVLQGIVADDAVSSVPEGVRASLRIAEGRAEVEAGCNTGGGSVAVDETAGTLTFEPLDITKKACEPQVMGVEEAVLATLDGEVRYTIEADVLTLTNGERGLVLRAEG